jgi:hypothetical protein
MAHEYQIQVQGSISDRWTSWFEGMTIEVKQTSDGSQFTTLTGPLTDQAALRGILIKLWNLNLILVSVMRVDSGVG